MKIFNIILAAAGLLTATAGMAQEPFKEGGVMYVEDLSDPSRMAVLVAPGFNMATMQSIYSGDIVVPPAIEHDLDTYEVVGLAPSCFTAWAANINSIEINAPIKTIPMQSAIMCERLKILRLPDTVEELSTVVTPNLEELYLGNSLKSVSQAFTELTKLTQLNIPASVEKIEMSFINCPSLKTLDLTGGHLASINSTFSGTMSGLESLSIAGNGLDIEYSFSNLPELTELNLTGKINKISLSFGDMPKLTKLVIPDGISEISNSFLDLGAVELTISDEVTNINNSFRTMPNIQIIRLGKGYNNLQTFYKGVGETIYCPWDDVPEAPEFRENSSTKPVTFVVPKGMEAKYREAWADKLPSNSELVIFREEKF